MPGSTFSGILTGRLIASPAQRAGRAATLHSTEEETIRRGIVTAVERLLGEAVEQGYAERVTDTRALSTVAAIIANATAHKAVSGDRQAA